MEKGKVVSLEDRIPKLKQQRRKKANRRLILLLLFFFSLIAFVIYFQSPLSHINKINVTGNSIYSYDELIAISGLNEKTNVWKVEDKAIEGKLIKLPEIKTAKVQITLPNTVTITLEEYKRIAYIMKEKSYLPVIENGKILNDDKISGIPANAPILIGFSQGNVLNGMIKELEILREEVLNSISEIHHTPKNTDAFHLTLFMNDGYEVSATVRSFSEKMAHYPSIVSQLDPEKKGIIDLEVGSYFKAYEQEGADKIEEEKESEG
ncbi:FtsQ-type POTRA domain-containing protein [Bacillus sp. FJAT-29790]|uniref:cell division protein FtsQ/DivIB n=1 Tax=Bacillus sp. FJAT-29790 TaxID=1895002 RepID=UPI001C24AE9A|nr:FtsQ-type POTRA domain-containing protein [Bacillus sp. FJAT-29790]MBU8877727.1 FtsQ-type POTRA domain-containing protein [Bacillus sp. FJAT-29790]